MRFGVCIVFALLFGSLPASLAALDMPTSAGLISTTDLDPDSYAVPIGMFEEGEVPVRVFEGHVARQSWRVEAGSSTTLQYLGPLRKQLIEQGYEILLECADQACGGFDFRFAIEVLPAPDMAVDIGDFRFVSAVRGQSEAATILISRAGPSLLLQTVQVAPSGAYEPVTDVDTAPEVPPVIVSSDEFETALIPMLLAEGRVVLEDLEFAPGNATLEQGSYSSLEILAAFLAENETYALALVGHTDSVGSLDENIGLSKRRAGAVRDILISEFGVDASRLHADGVGYLSPRTSNLTKEGRKINRRVEAVLLTQ
ncbi:MAG: OmpA family protein [Paracoccaceae bacterium]